MDLGGGGGGGGGGVGLRGCKSSLCHLFKISRGFTDFHDPPLQQHTHIATTPTQHVNRCFPCCSVGRTNSYQSSYFPNTIANWNSLPIKVTECASVQTFKKYVISFL